MILACLTTAALGGALPPVTADEPAARTALVVRIEQTRLQLENPGAEPVLLLFALEGREPQIARWLAPGASVAESFARGATRGMELEVVQPTAAGLVSSGALELDAPGPGETRALWVQQSGVVLGALNGEPIAPVVPDHSLLPAGAQHLLAPPGTELPMRVDPLHVPVPQSNGGSSGDKPPRLEKRPLPPV